MNENAQNICFNRNSQLALANHFAKTGIRLGNKDQNKKNNSQLEVAITNKIHFFKFD